MRRVLGDQRGAQGAARGLEQSRREAEHNDVSIQRFPGFGTNGTPFAKWGTRQFFNQMSNQLRRRYLIVIVVLAIGIVFLLSR